MTLTITEYIPEPHDQSLISSPSKPSHPQTQQDLSSPNNNRSSDLANNNLNSGYQILHQQQVPTTPMINTDPKYYNNIDYSNNSSFSPYKVSR